MGGAHVRRLDLIVVVVLLAALAAGLGLRADAQHVTPNVQHDEAWSYASAAGKLGPFLAALGDGPQSLTGRWAPVTEWRQFWTSKGPADLSQIAAGLSAHDVHPPLYFDLLHVWLQTTGTHVWAGRSLNLVFAAFTVLGIFGLAGALGFTRLEGALAALVWAVSPAVVSVSSIARQYDLVALTAVLLVWGLAGAVKQPERARWPYLLWVTAAAAAALLTHYQMAILVAGAAVYVLAGPLLPGAKERRGTRWPPLLALGAGVAAAALLAPGWMEALRNERGKLGSFSPRLLDQKVAAIGQTFGRFTGLPDTAAAVLALAIVALLVVLLVAPRTPRDLTRRVREARPGWWVVLFFLVVTAGGVCLQNLLFLSMPPRLSARYLAMAWPFLAFLPLLLSGLWPRARYWLTAAFCLLVLLPAAIAAPLPHGSADRLPLGRLADADAVLVDNASVGELPRILWSVPPDARVFVGTQEQLLADQRGWRGAALGARAYYVSVLRSGGAAWRRDLILQGLLRTHDVSPLASNGFTQLYEVAPRKGD